jgi:hypothetical protein
MSGGYVGQFEDGCRGRQRRGGRRTRRVVLSSNLLPIALVWERHAYYYIRTKLPRVRLRVLLLVESLTMSTQILSFPYRTTSSPQRICADLRIASLGATSQVEDIVCRPDSELPLSGGLGALLLRGGKATVPGGEMAARV